MLEKIINDGTNEQSFDAVVAEAKMRLPWLWLDGFRVADAAGYDGNSFGVIAGPHTNKTVWNLTHEVAHMIEMTTLSSSTWKRRSSVSAFGMRIKTSVTIGGRVYYEPATMQATERECRVEAFRSASLSQVVTIPMNSRTTSHSR